MTHPHQVLILVIEDDEPVRQTLVDLLELNGHTVIAADNGRTGLEMARRDQPALILTDVNMPELTGFELLGIFAGDETLRSTPVIVITAKADRSAMRRGMELGAADFITKPFTEEEVLHSVATRLEKKELLDELDAFAHTVAHDLKNPLATLTLQLGLLGVLLGPNVSDKSKHQLEESVKSCARLGSIIDELLLLAGVRRKVAKSEPLDMGAIVKESIDRGDYLMQREKAQIELPSSWPVSVGHAPWVAHVWVNYLSNAAKYGGPSPRIRLGGAASADGRTVRYWVEDRGAGLDAEAVGKMFVPFTRIGSVRASGHGLGLSIVRRIVEKLGGTVGVESSPGAGARFWFELPTRAPSLSASPFPRGEPPAIWLPPTR